MKGYVSSNECDMKFLFAFILLLMLVPCWVTGQLSGRLQTVVIDPGHGGKDPGAVVKNIREKDVTLAVSLKLGQAIQEHFPGIKVYYTRSTDVFVPLDDRAKLANEKKADLFISIHANWISKSDIAGTETFVLGLHRSQDNLEVAKKENAVIVLEDDYTAKYEGFDPNSTESYIIFELLQNVYLEQSISMASLIEKKFNQQSKRTSRGVKQAGFLVLRQTAMPSVLVELGFLTNANDQRFLTSADGQSSMAASLLSAFKDYKTQFEGQSGVANSVDDKHNAVTVVNSGEGTKAQGGSSIREVTSGTLPVSSVVFRIQVKTSPTPLSKKHSLYKSFNDLWRYTDKGSYKYTTFSTSSHDEAKEKLIEVREKVPDAFIIAFEKNQRITIAEALNKLKQ